MQSKAKISYDARTFQQIWESLGKDERHELSSRIYQNKCAGAPSTIWFWGNGKKAPASPLIRETVSKVVGSFLNIKTHPKILFP